MPLKTQPLPRESASKRPTASTEDPINRSRHWQSQWHARAIEFDLKAGRIADAKLDSTVKATFKINDMTLRQDLKNSMKLKPISPPKAAEEKPSEGDDSSK